MTTSEKLQHIDGDGRTPSNGSDLSELSGPIEPRWTDPLERPERNLLEYAETGDLLDLPLYAPPTGDQEPPDVDAMREWGPNRSIRAEVLRHLLVSSQWPVHPKGVQLRGARIRGTLDLDSVELRCPLVLEGCYLDIDGPVDLHYATVSRLQISRCWLPGLNADLLIVTKELDLSRSTSEGPVHLRSADITGRFNCRGTRIFGVDEDGNSLNADQVTVGGDVLFDRSEKTENKFMASGAVRFLGANISGQLNCRGAQINGTDHYGDSLIAHRITVGGRVLLAHNFAAKGAVKLIGARITGDLNCRGAKIKGTDNRRNALNADRATVGGNLSLNWDEKTKNRFEAAGAIRLLGANINGRLNCRGALITGVDDRGNSVFADLLTVGGDVLLEWSEGTDEQGEMVKYAFTASGTVRLPRATISGRLNCKGARIGPVDGGPDAQIDPTHNAPDALIADGVTVGRVLLEEITVCGAVRLRDANITGELRCSGARITGTATNKDPDTDPDKDIGVRNAIIADRVRVSGSVLLDKGFTANGTVRFLGAMLEGRLSLEGATITDPVAFRADGATIRQELIWAPKDAVSGVVSLERTHLHRLDDDWSDGTKNAYWPKDGNLWLAGFEYDEFGGSNKATCKQRLDWIRGQHMKVERPGTLAQLLTWFKSVLNRPQGQQLTPTESQGNFDAQSYEQLARVYRQAGQDSEARETAIARRSDLRNYGDLGWWRRKFNWLVGFSVGHGYKPFRAVGLLVAVWLIALMVFWVGQHRTDAMVPTDPDVKPVPSAMVCTKQYTCFSPAGYAFDVTIPIVKNGQAESWRPNAEATGGLFFVYSGWFFTGAGWALAALVGVGYTGLIRKD